MPFSTQVLDAISQAATIDLRAWMAAWARVTPSVVLIPAFGLRAIPAPARVAFALVLAACIAPAVVPATSADEPWAMLALRELVRGVPVAFSAAVTLWTATMVGGLVDNLRGARETSTLPIAESGASPLGALLSLFTALVFLSSGGASRVALAVTHAPPLSAGLLERTVLSLTSGVEVAVAIAAPIVAASIVLEVATALVTRAMMPAVVQAVIAPLRTIALLAILALLLDRIVELLALRAVAVP